MWGCSHSRGIEVDTASVRTRRNLIRVYVWSDCRLMSRRRHCKVLSRWRPAYFVWILVPGRDNVWELVLELLLELVVVVGKSGLLHQVLLLALLLP